MHYVIKGCSTPPDEKMIGSVFEFEIDDFESNLSSSHCRLSIAWQSKFERCVIKDRKMLEVKDWTNRADNRQNVVCTSFPMQ